MPPKARWQVQPTAATPDFNSKAAVVHSVGPKPETMSEAVAQLKKFIVRTINDNNLLQISDAEVESTANLIASCTDKQEIFNWASTLMLSESFAAEVVKRREDITRLGTRTDDDMVSSTSMATAASKASKKKSGAGARGRQVNLANKGGDETGGLVEGQTFECGCFATQHAFRGNCQNCGRIICMQESDDSCYACGFDPGMCLAYEVKKAEGRIDAAADAKNRADYDEALRRRDNLMQFARERAKRTIVIDDQSGMYANTAWITKEEREASKVAETDERKRVAQMHRQSGAYTVHLDIVNQSASLGACGMPTQRAADSVARNAASGNDATVALTDAEAAAQYGLAGADPSPATTSGNPDEVPATAAGGARGPMTAADELRLMQPTSKTKYDDVTDSDDGYGDDSDADDGEVLGGAARVHALPSLVQRIMYGDAANASSSTITLKKKQADADAAAGGHQQQPGGADAGFKGHVAGQDKDGVKARAAAAESRRVQTDYYEDDRVTWRVARQERRLGAAVGLGGDDDDGAENGGGEGPGARRAEQPNEARRRVPPPPAAATSSSYAAGGASAAAADDDDDEPDCGAAASAPAPSAAVSYADAYKRLRLKDDGMCLSMHQPWASLLIEGIKTHEGRTWPSDFRGRLWIHAAAARPSHVEEIEAQYVPFLRPGQTFPTDYPTSCLLGYVTAVDNLDCDAYERAFTPEERQESSDFKFICMGAKALPFPLAMDGKHKVFKLEKKLWLASRKQLGEGPPR